MKRLVVLFLILTFVLTSVACGNSASSDKTDTTGETDSVSGADGDPEKYEDAQNPSYHTVFKLSFPALEGKDEHYILANQTWDGDRSIYNMELGYYTTGQEGGVWVTAYEGYSLDEIKYKEYVNGSTDAKTVDNYPVTSYTSANGIDFYKVEGEHVVFIFQDDVAAYSIYASKEYVDQIKTVDKSSVMPITTAVGDLSFDLPEGYNEKNVDEMVEEGTSHVDDSNKLIDYSYCDFSYWDEENRSSHQFQIATVEDFAEASKLFDYDDDLEEYQITTINGHRYYIQTEQNPEWTYRVLVYEYNGKYYIMRSNGLSESEFNTLVQSFRFA